MARLTAIVLFALIGVCAVQGTSEPDWSKHLKANSQATSFAFTKNGVSAIKTTASAQSSYRVQQAAAKVIAHAVSSIYGGTSAKAASYAASKAIATALAEVYVQNSSKGHVKGKGVAIGSAKADAHAYAEATSSAIASAYSLATNNKFRAEAKALSVALTRTLARAYANLKTTVKVGPGGHVQSYHAIYVKAFSEAISHAIAIALSKVEADYYSGGSHSTAHSIANSHIQDGSIKVHTGGVYKKGNSHISVVGGGDHYVDQYKNW